MGNNQQLKDQLLHRLAIRFLNRKCHNHLQSRKSLIQCWLPARKNQHQEDVLPFSNHQTDMEFVQNFTPPDFQAKNFTPSISPNFNSFSKKKHKK